MIANEISESAKKKLKDMDRVAYIVSLVVLALVLLMRRIKIPVEIDFSFLPPSHAIINGLAALALIAAYYFIKKGQVERHKKAIYVAIFLSVLFLLSYVVYHFTTPETLYCKQGWIRYLYFFFLITHVVLAALILPFILLTFNRAYLNLFDKHKKMARWVFPFWLYVAVTGPVCYLLLKPCYT